VSQPVWLPLQQINLRALRQRLCETDPNADETHRFSRASERFGEERPKIRQSGREPGAFGGGAGKIVELKFHKDLGYRSGRFFLREISHQFLKEFLQSLFALLQRGKIDSERFLGAERFARTIRFDRPIIDPAAKIIEFNAEFAEKIDQLGARKALQFAASF